MNKPDYIQTVRAAIKVGKYISDMDLVLPYINDVRVLHKKFQDGLDYLLLDPISFEKQQERDKLQSIAKEIVIVCSSGGIKCKFFKIPVEWTQFRDSFKKSKLYATYSYNDIDITDLIVYIKKSKISSSKDADIEILDDEDIKLDELSFTDEENKDENTITEAMGGELPGGL